MNEEIQLLDKNYQQIGLSADWECKTWLLNTKKSYSIVICENYEEDNYILIKSQINKDDEREDGDIITGTVTECLSEYMRLSKQESASKHIQTI